MLHLLLLSCNIADVTLTVAVLYYTTADVTLAVAVLCHTTVQQMLQDSNSKCYTCCCCPVPYHCKCYRTATASVTLAVAVLCHTTAGVTLAVAVLCHTTAGVSLAVAVLCHTTAGVTLAVALFQTRCNIWALLLSMLWAVQLYNRCNTTVLMSAHTHTLTVSLLFLA